MLASDLLRLGIRLRFVRVRPDAGWMFESLTTVARRALGVAILRRNRF